jgi:hypothetical protein
MLLASSPELTGAYISASVAALAIIASVLTTWLTLRNQRLLAEEDRLSNRRAAAYERLLGYQHENPNFEGFCHRG